MAPDEEEQGMGTSGEIRRGEAPPELEAARASALELRRLLRRLDEKGVDIEPLRQDLELMDPEKAASTKPAGYAEYGEFVKDELETQDRRKGSFEQRGLAVITTSGVLAALLFGLTAFATKKSGSIVIPHSAHSWLIASVVLFFLSAVTALVTNFPLKYEAVDPPEVWSRLQEEPVRDADRAAKDIALTRLKTLTVAKKKNTWKGRALITALACEAFAVGCLAVAIALILVR